MTTLDNVQVLHFLAALFFAAASMASLGAMIWRSVVAVLLTGGFLFFGMLFISAVTG